MAVAFVVCCDVDGVDDVDALLYAVPVMQLWKKYTPICSENRKASNHKLKKKLIETIDSKRIAKNNIEFSILIYIRYRVRLKL